MNPRDFDLRLIRAGERSGLQTHIATMENGLLSARMKS